MKLSICNEQSIGGPRRKNRRDRHDEAPQLLEDVPANIENTIPVEQVEENESIDKNEDAENDTSSVFIEGPTSCDEPQE